MLAFLKDLLNAWHGTTLAEDDVVSIGRETLRDELKFNKQAEFCTGHDPDPVYVLVAALPPSGVAFDAPEEKVAKT